MKARNIILMAAIAVLSLSCSKNTTDYSKYYPNYILTCKTDDAGTFYLARRQDNGASAECQEASFRGQGSACACKHHRQREGHERKWR